MGQMYHSMYLKRKSVKKKMNLEKKMLICLGIWFVLAMFIIEPLWKANKMRIVGKVIEFIPDVPTKSVMNAGHTIVTLREKGN